MLTKTQYSFSTDPQLRGARLSEIPASDDIDIDAGGQFVGLA